MLGHKSQKQTRYFQAKGNTRRRTRNSYPMNAPTSTVQRIHILGTVCKLSFSSPRTIHPKMAGPTDSGTQAITDIRNLTPWLIHPHMDQRPPTIRHTLINRGVHILVCVETSQPGTLQAFLPSCPPFFLKRRRLQGMPGWLSQ